MLKTPADKYAQVMAAAAADQPDAEGTLQTFLHSYPPGCPKLREFTATLLDVSRSDPAKFFRDLTAQAKQPSPGQPPRIVVAVPRVRAAQVVLEAATTPAQLAAVQAAASKHSLMAFQCFAQTLKEDNAKDPDQPILGIRTASVGLMVQGRISEFDLLYYPHVDKSKHELRFFARDNINESIVYLLHSKGRS